MPYKVNHSWDEQFPVKLFFVSNNKLNNYIKFPLNFLDAPDLIYSAMIILSITPSDIIKPGFNH